MLFNFIPGIPKSWVQLPSCGVCTQICMLITLSGPLVKGAVLAFWIKVRLNFEDGFYPLSTLEKLLNYYVPQICVWFFGDFWTYALDQGRKHCENFRIVSPFLHVRWHRTLILRHANTAKISARRLVCFQPGTPPSETGQKPSPVHSTTPQLETRSVGSAG